MARAIIHAHLQKNKIKQGPHRYKTVLSPHVGHCRISMPGPTTLASGLGAFTVRCCLDCCRAATRIELFTCLHGSTYSVSLLFDFTQNETPLAFYFRDTSICFTLHPWLYYTGLFLSLCCSCRSSSHFFADRIKSTREKKKYHARLFKRRLCTVPTPVE